MRAWALALCTAAVQGKIYFQETFEDGLGQWEEAADVKLGLFENGHGPLGGFYGKGLRTTDPKGKFYAISANWEEETDNEGKTFVLSYTLQNPQNLSCGGGYLKVLPTVEDQEDFDGDVPYWIMFGPDICGAKSLSLFFDAKGTHDHSLHWRKAAPTPEDRLTHLFTLVVRPDDTYEISIDGDKYEWGKIEDDFEFTAPKKIEDPEHRKPEDWVDHEEIPDPRDKRPKNWDDDAEIDDPNAVEPEDWDEDRDGVWDPPGIPNPNYQGPWKPKMIPNPKFKGHWKPRMIDNPAYKPMPNLHVPLVKVGAIGIDIWQVESGTVYDNIIIADNEAEVEAFNKKHFFAHRDAEKAAYAKLEKEEKAKKEREQVEEREKAKAFAAARGEEL
eukprot:TRINITY_DN375_c0_g3_i1.p1 TRINITY_DN375_c0_g3~~TRINITY_DN375_c0_g3_i1.p1  ORF type:complete len:386 (+),score=162.62 TRINITY_DN375_c0_g3_i1:57-1214(+)